MTLRIEILGEKAWRPIRDAAFERLAARGVDAAEVVLASMHNRHVGITPGLAAELAELLTGDRRGTPGTGVWSLVLRRLDSEVSSRAQSRSGPRARVGGGLVPSAAPYFFAFRVALPLIERACAELGRCVLFGESQSVSGGFDYRKYATDLRARIMRYSGADDPALATFWYDRAMTLKSLSTPGATKGRRFRAAPDVDPLSSSLMYRIQPDQRPLMPRKATHRPRAEAQRAVRQRRSEGGISGITVTRREADLGGILLSEFMNPEPILLDRLVNHGFYALLRPPRRRKKKHVLVAGMMPAPLPETYTGQLARAAWMHAMTVLAQRLIAADLKRSAFLWVEGDKYGADAECRVDLETIPEGGVPSVKQMMGQLHWMPSVHDRGRLRRADPALDLADSEAGADDWLRRAWRQAIRLPLQSTRPDQETGAAKRTGQRLPEADFQAVHVVAFLPETAWADGVDANIIIDRVKRNLGLGREKGRSVSALRVPATESRAPWLLAFEGERDFIDADLGDAAVARRLIHAWASRVADEVFGG